MCESEEIKTFRDLRQKLLVNKRGLKPVSAALSVANGHGNVACDRTPAVIRLSPAAADGVCGCHGSVTASPCLG